MGHGKLPPRALDVLLKEKEDLTREIQDRLKVAFSHVAYAGAVLAFAIPLATQARNGWIVAVAVVFAVLACIGLVWVARLNMRWVQHAGAYQRIVERKLANHFGSAVAGWEHYAQTASAGSWMGVPKAPDTTDTKPQAGWQGPVASFAQAAPKSLPRFLTARSAGWLVAWLAACLVLLTSCASPSSSQLLPAASANRKLAVFFDGTANDEASDTNVKKLHSLVTLQNRPEVSTLYIEGVGTDGKFVGMATAWGAGHRVRMAYRYLLHQHRAGDAIYLFGFSRGAYGARILASMLYYVGLPTVDLEADPNFVDDAYDAFKGDQPNRRKRIQDLLATRGIGNAQSVPVKLLGLWDTVEAHGIPDYSESPDESNPLYGDQLCNIDRALHAVSLDDDRARIFTPLLLTRPHLLDDCVELKAKWADPEARSMHLNRTVEEVWFAGAHSDVGGGYRNSLLSGVSLNWMLRQLDTEALVPASTQVREDAFDASHDPESGIWGLIYRQQSRNLPLYARSSTTIYNGGKLKVHKSAFDRLVDCKQKKCERQGHEFPWGTAPWDEACFRVAEGRLTFVGAAAASCFIVRNEG